MKIKYTPVGQGPEVPKPYITLIMCGQQQRMKVDGLIDSGADHNLFPMELAEVCEIDLRGAQKVKVSGFNHGNKKDKGYLVSVKFVLENYEWTGDTVFVETKQPHGILGQKGFFNAFDITFSFSRGIIELVPTTAQLIDTLR